MLMLMVRKKCKEIKTGKNYWNIVLLITLNLSLCVFLIMDWNKCALCQRSSNNLVGPSKNKNVDIDGYSKLAENINLFVIDD